MLNNIQNKIFIYQSLVLCFVTYVPNTTDYWLLKIDIFEVFGYGDLEKEKVIADFDASRRDLARSIFQKIVATLQAKILTIK